MPPSPVSANANVHEKSIKPPSRARQAAGTKLLKCNTSSCGGWTCSTTKPGGAGWAVEDAITYRQRPLKVGNQLGGAGPIWPNSSRSTHRAV